MKRFIPLALAVMAVFTPLLFFHSCANTKQAPTGGKKDTIPPYIVNIVPLPGVTRVPLTGAKFYFEFNEYVAIKQAKNIFLSPPQQKPVKSKLKNKGIIVYFEEPLDSNTTYTISFVDAIADVNEGNMFAGYTYVFSTGDRIDSMMVTGTVQDCNSLDPVKGATVLLYKDHSDSAVFLKRPYAAAKTDDWGFFCIPYIQDTTYRIYALKDDSGNNIYDPDVDLVGFVDSLIRPVMVANDTIKEMLKYDMKDTLSCMERKSEYDLSLFREKPSKQFLKNSKRIDERSAYISFQAPNVWIDSLWIRGYRSDRIITQFNILQDSLEIWINDRKPVPDTLHLYVNYRKTDSLGKLSPFLEHVRMFVEGSGVKKKKTDYTARKKLTHDDTTCVFTLKATPENFEIDGFDLEFKYPVVTAKFDSLIFKYINPKQQEFKSTYSVEMDSLNPRKYRIFPKEKIVIGNEYVMKVPAASFRDIRGFWSDSTEVKVSLPTDDKLSTLHVPVSNVDRKVIVELLNESRDKVIRKYIITSDTVLEFPFLPEGKYCIRISDDGNNNSFVDTGVLLEHRLPEKVVFAKFGKGRLLDIPASSEIEQPLDIKETLK